VRLRYYRVRRVRRLAHPCRGFTQGLVLRGTTVWESCGLYGQSVLRRYELGANQPERSGSLAPDLFGEGICLAGDHLWQLTWRERVALRWDPQTLDVLDVLPYTREGWGICQVGDRLVTSDGSSELVWRDPLTLERVGIIKVRLAGRRLDGLNDLDWSAGRIWANIWPRPYLAGIDPASGEVTDVIDAGSVRERLPRDPDAVMNGVAALPAAGEFLLAGKRWRFLHHVRLIESRPRHWHADLLPGG
jgi:glutamine cyclotransferase